MDLAQKGFHGHPRCWSLFNLVEQWEYPKKVRMRQRSSAEIKGVVRSIIKNRRLMFRAGLNCLDASMRGSSIWFNATATWPLHCCHTKNATFLFVYFVFMMMNNNRPELYLDNAYWCMQRPYLILGGLCMNRWRFICLILKVRFKIWSQELMWDWNYFPSLPLNGSFCKNVTKILIAGSQIKNYSCY